MLFTICLKLQLLSVKESKFRQSTKGNTINYVGMYLYVGTYDNPTLILAVLGIMTMKPISKKKLNFSNGDLFFTFKTL